MTLRRPIERLVASLVCIVAAAAAAAPALAQAAPDPVRAQFGAGTGPSDDGRVMRLLDAARTKGQSNAIAWDRSADGPRATFGVRCKLRVTEGGDGGAFVFLSTTEFGAAGPAPFVGNWTEPNLRGTFAVGIDVHNPKNDEPFSPWGNYQGLPEREVSLHWDGREIVKRVAPVEFRGDIADLEIAVVHVVGGAEVTVRLAGAAVYDRHFVAGLLPYESRLAIGAGTRDDAATEFDVRDLAILTGDPAPKARPAAHFEVFHHVMTDNAKTAFEKVVDLPPAEWAFGRVILNLEIHDAGDAWDEWDRNGEVSIVTADGTKLGIVPFITSYRTPCKWQVDVTHFRPWLAGKTRFEIAAGTTFYKNRGYLMSVSLDFHHGATETEPFRIVPLWVGIAHHGAAGNHFSDFFRPQTVAIDAETCAARIFTTTTGHSQVGEFTPSKRTIAVRADATDAASELRFENTLWKDDCYLNPNRPQFGTWKYSRAGWAPGDVVLPWWIDLTQHVRPGTTASFAYEPAAYDFAGEPQKPSEGEVAQASHVVRSYLVLYRKSAARMAAPSLRILNVADGSNAAKAGLREGDYLASYEGRALRSLDDLRAAIAAAAESGKDSFTVVAYRGTERIEVNVGPGKLGVALANL